MKLVVDESASLTVALRLRDLGHQVIAIAEAATSGLPDEAVFALAHKTKSILVTRDHGFTRSIRYPPSSVGAIVDIRPGNLKCDGEVRLVERFFDTHKPESFAASLVTLYRNGVKIWK